MFLVPPMQVAVAVASILLVVYFFTRPLIALVAVFLLRGVLDLLWWIPGTIMGLNMMQLFSAAVFVLVTTQLFLDLKRLQEHPCFKLLLGFVVLMVIAIARCDDIPRNLDSIVRYSSPFMLFFMVSIHFDKEEYRSGLIKWIAIIGLIPLSVSLWYYVTGQMAQVELHGYNRLLGGYKNLHNMALMTLFFASIYVFWLWRAPSMFTAVIFGGLALLITFTLYKTYIRTGLLGMAVFMTVFMLAYKRYRTLAVVLVAGVGFMVFDASMQDRFGDFMLIFDTDNIALDKRKLGSGRWGIWTMSLSKYMQQSPWDLILGLGLGGQRAMTIDWVRLFHAKHTTLDPHNDMLLVLFQLGPLGVATYLGFQYQTVKYALKLRNAPESTRFGKGLAVYVIALTATVFVTNSISNSFVHRTSPGWYYWCMCGLMFAQWADIQAARKAASRELKQVA
jgi:O-antigen ligase